MATTPRPTPTTETAPAAPADPGIIAGTLVLGFVPLTGTAAERAVQAAANNAPRISWGNLVTLKLLLPRESSSVIISPWGDEQLRQVVESLMEEMRGNTR